LANAKDCAANFRRQLHFAIAPPERSAGARRNAADILSIRPLLKAARKARRAVATTPTAAAPAILSDIRRLIAEARGHVASTANATLTMLYWQVGQRIRTEVLRDQRAIYGERIVASLGRQLSVEYGKGFEEKNLRRMMRFTEIFPEEQIVASLMRQLSWTHFVELLPIKDPLQREFYSEMSRSRCDGSLRRFWSASRAIRAGLEQLGSSKQARHHVTR
jgi:hypothetical protein